MRHDRDMTQEALALASGVTRNVLIDVDLSMPESTALYGEGFQMLTQTGGTLGAPIDFSQYTDAKHYRIPASE